MNEELILGLARLAAGLALLVVGADALVRGAARLAARLGVPSLVVGLTVVAFGTSAPELAVSVTSTLEGQADVALGNVVGSNIFNVLVILGLAALIAPLVVEFRFVRLEVPLMLAASVLVPWLGADGAIDASEGALLVVAGVLYTWFTVRRSGNEARPAEPSPSVGARPWRDVGAVMVGLVLLVLGSRWLVAAAVWGARAAGVSELVVGLTIVAAGTSLPEVAASLVAAWRGERDIAVGNVVGSNIFNVLVVLGASAAVSGSGVAVASEALALDLPVMVAVAFACLPVFRSGGRIDRWEGLLLLAYYVAYIAYRTLGHAGERSAFVAVMVAFVLPVTILTLVLMCFGPRSVTDRATHAGAGPLERKAEG